ncbi:MAG: amidohydrolase family protein, partial [Pseudomonadota bacterium]
LAAGNELLSLGITTVHDPGISAREARVMKTLAAEGVLPIRIYAMLAGAGSELDAWGEPLLDFADGMFAVRAVKIYADGALGSRGAALIDEYSDEAGNSGLLFADGQELGDAIAKSNEAGFQANVHAIGDLANRVVLDGFERVQNGQASAHRNRIEHAQIVALEDIPRFAELGIIASMQPVHATSDMNMAEDRLGGERIKGGYAWRRMLDAGVRVASGSDFPVEYPNPMLGLHAAVNRTDTAGNPMGGWYKDQALSRAEALSSFTEEAAYAGHQEADLGRLASGYRADFIVVDRDYFEIPAGEIWQIKVLETWLGGERRYLAEEAGE